MTSTDHYGSWIAKFRDGPLAENRHERVMAVGPIRTDMYFMLHPASNREWVRVDFDGDRPDPPWPNQIHYRLVEVLTLSGEGGYPRDPVAYYVLAG